MSPSAVSRPQPSLTAERFRTRVEGSAGAAARRRVRHQASARGAEHSAAGQGRCSRRRLSSVQLSPDGTRHDRTDSANGSWKTSAYIDSDASPSGAEQRSTASELLAICAFSISADDSAFLLLAQRPESLFAQREFPEGFFHWDKPLRLSRPPSEVSP